MINKKRTVIVLAIISLIMVAFLGGQTFAKYFAQVKGEGVAQVASWNFKVNGQESQTQTINLASTYNNETLLNNKIAPGTKGSFDIIVDATGSDVGIDYKIDFANQTTKPQNLKFTYDKTTVNNIEELESILTGRINANEENKKVTLKIDWEWKYETGNDETEISNNDIIDTKNAKEIQDYEFDVIVSGTQVNPNS